jgi:hypothetical protein
VASKSGSCDCFVRVKDPLKLHKTKSFSFGDFSPDPPINSKGIHADKAFQFIQQFYSDVAAQVKDTLALSLMNPNFGIPIVDIIRERERNNNPNVELPVDLLEVGDDEGV